MFAIVNNRKQIYRPAQRRRESKLRRHDNRTCAVALKLLVSPPKFARRKYFEICAATIKRRVNLESSKEPKPNTNMNSFTISSISRTAAGKMYDAKPMAGDETFDSVEAAKAAAVERWTIGVSDILIYSESTAETVVGYVNSKKEFVEEFRGDYSAAREILNEAY